VVVKYIFTLSANGCSNYDTLSVTVKPTPKLSSVKTITASCSGTINYVAASTLSGSNFVWVRNPVAGIVPTINNGTGNISETISNTTPNILTTYYYYTITANGCPEQDTLSVIVNPKPVLNSTKTPSGVCTGSTFNYTPTSATPGTVFVWNRPTIVGITNPANTGTGSISEVLVNSTSSPIVVSYIYTLTANGCSNIDTVKVTVNTLPTANITSPKNYICAGGTVDLQADSFKGYSFQWLLNNSNISGANSKTLSVNTIGNYTVKITDSNGCINTSSVKTITSKSLPNAAITPLTQTAVCLGGSVALMVDTITKAKYQWYFNGTLLTGDTNRIYITTNSGNYSYKVTDSFGCTNISAPQAVSFSPTPVSAAAALGGTNFCIGGSVTLMSNISPGSTYQWRKNNVDIVGQTTVFYTATTTGGYQVNICNGGCCVLSNTILVQVDTPPTIAISPNTIQNLCVGSSITLTATAGAGYIYQWVVNGVDIFGANGSTYNATDSGYYSVRVSRGACSVNSLTVRVELRNNPPVPFNIKDTSYCIGEPSSPVKASANAGNILKWYTTPTGGVGSTVAPTPSTAVPDTIKYYVSQVNNYGCESPRVPLVVKVSAPPLKPIVSNFSYCQGSLSNPLTALLTNGDTLLWYTTPTGVSSIIPPTPNTSVVGIFKFYVSQKIGAICEGPKDTILVTIKSNPNKPMADSTVIYCQGDSSVPLTAILSSDTLIWYNTATGGIGSKIAPKPSTLVAGTFKYYVSQRNISGCESPRREITVIVNPAPLLPIVSDRQYCQGQVVGKLSATPDIGNTLKWYTSATGGIGDTIAPIPSTIDTGLTIYYVSQVSTLGCEGPRAALKVHINFKGKIPPTSRDTVYCQFQKVDTLTAVTIPGNSLLWYLDSTTTISLSKSPTPNTNVVGTVTYYVSQVTPLGCESPRAPLKVTVNPTPSAPVTHNTSYCHGGIADTLIAVFDPNNYLKWYDTIVGGVYSLNNPYPNTSKVDTITYYVSQTNQYQCESPRSPLKVIIYDSKQDTVIFSNCNQFIYNKKSYTTTTSFVDTFRSFKGCDSLYRNVFINIYYPDTTYLTACTYNGSYNYNGNILTSSGLYSYVYKNKHQCDSQIYLNLSVVSLKAEFKDTTLCSAFAYRGVVYNDNVTIVRDTLKNRYLCDSVIRYWNLRIPKPITKTGDSISRCDSIYYRGIWHYQTTSIFDTIKMNIAPYCDSIYTENKLNIIHRLPVDLVAIPDTVLAIGDTVTLTCNPSLHYIWSTGSNQSSILAYPLGSKYYYVTVEDINHCINADTIYLKVIDDESDVLLPNAFSPNGDGINDILKPNIIGKARVITLMIFNRWGEKMYEGSENDCGWDGSFQGVVQPDGLYRYYIYFQKRRNRGEKKGSIMLIH
jgi:gliding motility-associated-like protein